MNAKATCRACGASGTHAKGLCTPCYWHAHREEAKRTCPGCGTPGTLRPDEGGVCGWCARRARPRKQPVPRRCGQCGALALHAGYGLCNGCYQRHPDRVTTWAQGALARLGQRCPGWFEALALDMSARGSSANALEHLRQVERCILAGAGDPEAVLEAVRASGRSVGATARLVGEFFEREGLCRALDDTDERARGPRARRLGRLGPSLRPVVGAFAEHLLGQRKRARLLGSNGLSDTTIEHRLADIAAFGALLGERGIDDWAAVSAGDVDAFLVANMNSRVASLRAFFAFAKQRKVVLVDPTAGVDHRSPKGFSGRVLLRSEQRELLGRWARPDVNANERAAGLLSLLHGAGSYELRHLLAEDIDLDRSRVVLGRRRFAVPVDPITVAALRACLAARESLVTENPHLIITKDSRMHTRPCSQYYVFHLFDDLGVSPQVLRQTRLVHVAHRADPRVLAIAFGLTEGGALHYMADSVDHEELAFGAKP